MKKIISVILLVIMLMTSVIIPVNGAGELSDNTLLEMSRIASDVYIMAESGRLYGTHGKYFGLNSAPDPKTMVCSAGAYCEQNLQDYIVRVNGMGHFEIPADLFEAVVFSVFTRTTAALNTLRSSTYYKTDRAKPYYIPDFSGQSYSIYNSLNLYGYKSVGGGNYEVYAYINDNSNYTPAAGDVLGRDYRKAVGATVTSYTNLEQRNVKHKYVSVKGVVKFVFNVGDNVTISAAEYMDKSINPYNDAAIIKWPPSAQESFGVYVHFENNVLTGANDYIDVVNLKSGEDFNKIKAALGANANYKFEVFKINLYQNNVCLTWSDAQYKFFLPYNAGQYDIYQLKADGTAVKLNATPLNKLSFMAGGFSAMPYYSYNMVLNLMGPMVIAAVKTDRAPTNLTAPQPVIKIVEETTAPPPVVTAPPETQPPETEPPVETTEPVSDVVIEEETTDVIEDTTKEETETTSPETTGRGKEEGKKETKRISPLWIVIPAVAVVLAGGATASFILIRKKKMK